MVRRAQEAPVAHPELDGAKNEAGEATVKQVDDPSNHGGAKRRRWRCSGDCGGQNGELWPRRHAHDGGVAGREEEEQRTGVPSEIK